MGLLQEAIQEALREVEELRTDGESDTQSRREQALLLVLHKLKQLSVNTHKSQRILNDLRTLRRLLFDDRGEETEEAAESAVAASFNWE